MYGFCGPLWIRNAALRCLCSCQHRNIKTTQTLDRDIRLILIVFNFIISKLCIFSSPLGFELESIKLKR